MLRILSVLWSLGVGYILEYILGLADTACHKLELVQEVIELSMTTV